MRGPSCFMESVWRDLSSDILEKVLTFLPIASLCRFRTVCKEWNRLISDPGFPARHAQVSSPEEYVLTTMRCEYSLPTPSGWEVLDVVNRRSFRLRDDFVDEYVLRVHGLHACNADSEFFSDVRTTMAADGGLFFVAYFFEGDCEILLVCNPVLRTVKELPTFPRLFYNQPTVLMSTDRVSMEYEIFVIHHADDEDHPNALHIYESKTGSWRAANSFAPQLLSCLFEERVRCPLSTFVENEFYRLIIKDDPSLDRAIVSYDKVTGVVSDLDIDLPCDGDELQLVVSKDRLFCVTITGSEGPPSIEIFEIIIARKECVRFTEMPSELVNWIRDGLLSGSIASTGDVRDCLRDGILFLSGSIASTGCANSILIHSSGGRSVACNLSNKSWHRFPKGRGLGGYRIYWPGCPDRPEFFASSYCLSLCAP